MSMLRYYQKMLQVKTWMTVEKRTAQQTKFNFQSIVN